MEGETPKPNSTIHSLTEMQSGYLEGRVTSSHDIPSASASPANGMRIPRCFRDYHSKTAVHIPSCPLAIGESSFAVRESLVGKGERERGFDGFKLWKERLKEAKGEKLFTFLGKSR